MKAFWDRQSIRTRLVAANTTSLALVLLIFAVGVSVAFWKTLEQGLHRELGREFEVVEGLINVSSSGIVRWGGDEQHEEADYEGEAIAAEVWASPTELLARTRAAERWAEKTGPLQLSWSTTGFDILLIGDERVHVLQGQHDVDDRHFLIRVFRSDTPIRNSTITLIWTLLVALFSAVTLTVALSYRVVGSLFLEPLAKMAEHAARISVVRSDTLFLPITNPNDELGRLGGVINNLLQRFDEAIGRIRRFSADASHELRTPLTSIRSVGEVCLRGSQSAEEYRDTIGSILEEIEGITRLLDSLLFLSKADEGKENLSKKSVNVLKFLDEIAEILTALSEPKGQTISVMCDRGLQINADSTVLRLALANLIDNAIKFGTPGSVVEICAVCKYEAVIIDVHNDGERIAPEHREHIFDRFYRIDSGRSRSVGGTGLGLSVARWAVEAHGGTLRVVADGKAGTTLRIRLPFTPETES